MTATAAKMPDALTAFHWEPQPQAAAFVKKVVDDFLEKLPEAKAFADRLYRETGNRFADLVSEVTLHVSKRELEDAGWSEKRPGQFINTLGMFPPVQVLTDTKDASIRIGIKCESVIDMGSALPQSWKSRVALGDPGAAYRSMTLYEQDMYAGGRDGTVSLEAVERHGVEPFSTGSVETTSPASEEVLDWFRLRERTTANVNEELVLDELRQLIDQAVNRVGRDQACDLFFAAEREYWQRRNTAAQFQKARQDKLGIGWANHDHHTYRSSRRHFHKLVGLWEKLGFECRERFYPGPEAGWGAQVMEQPVCGIVTFNDVDISEDEMLTDFAHVPMEDRTAEEGGLATVGLWCALHGESVLQAGMHHLECTFDFAALEEQMKTEAGIETMPKFTDFPHLKQAFTKGERWQVDPKRVDAILEKGLITEHQAKEFKKNGAIGSHLENLERNDGFKGFNQTGVTDIIKRTDPRRQTAQDE